MRRREQVSGERLGRRGIQLGGPERRERKREDEGRGLEREMAEDGEEKGGMKEGESEGEN